MFIDITGQKFTNLLVIGKNPTNYVYKDNKTKIRWDCVCDCGNKTTVLGCSLKKGTTKSCGCLAKTMLSKRTWTGYEEISGVYWNRLQTDAKKRNIAWELNVDYCWDVFLKQERKCAISGLIIYFERNFKKNGKQQTASLDRIDSKKGYLSSNIQWVHKTVNVLKWDLKTEELLYWCETICNHARKGGTEFH